MNLDNIHNIYFIGIGGIGMSALARYFNANNKNVEGYDKTQTDITNSLINLGIHVHFDDSIENIDSSFLNSENTLVHNPQRLLTKTSDFRLKARHIT